MNRSMLLTAMLTILSTVAVAQPAAPERQPAERTFGADRFVAGGNARVDQPVAGDLIAAGGHVDVDAPVSGDAVLAGGHVRLDGKVGQGVYAAGGDVTVNAAVGRSARIAGGHVELGPRSEVAGNVSIAGGEVRIRGTVKGYVQAAGGRVLVDGTVDGDVVATSGHLALGPNARIGGKLRYRGKDLQRDPAAQIAGGVEHVESPGKAHGEVRYRWGGWLWTAGLMVLAAIIAGALPAFSTRVTAAFRAQPWLALLFGFIALVCIPAAALLLMITIIGLPLGLLAILLYLALLLVGYVATAVGLGDAALRRFRAESSARAGWRIGAAVLAVLVLGLLVRVPYLGGIVGFVAILAGIGAIVLSLRRAAATPG